MPIQYEHIVPWGRNFEEYCNMFNLSQEDLTKNIISCGDGPASFNCEGTQKGIHITSIDPIYCFTKQQLAKRINETYDIVINQTIDNADNFV